jgi:hypothetical protein
MTLTTNAEDTTVRHTILAPIFDAPIIASNPAALFECNGNV